MFGWFKSKKNAPASGEGNLPEEDQSGTGAVATPDEENGTLDITCTGCGIRITVPVSCQGQEGTCFGCGATIRIPTAPIRGDHRKLLYQPNEVVAQRYRILKQLGKGGMGVVYQAEDTLMNEQVALKFMLPAYLESRKGRRLFIQEAQMARRLRHQNIVSTHDVGWTDDGILFLSMEFMQGQSLRQFLNTKRPTGKRIGVQQTVQIIEQLLYALHYAHSTIVHRDLKPENIMLLPDHEVKVLDFGLAKALEAAQIFQDADGSKHAQLIVGTRVYAAPEQKSNESIDARADIYTVGLLFFELLTLRAPTDEAVQLPKIRRDVAPSLMEVLDKSLEEDPDLRWQSAAAMRNALLSAMEEGYSAITVKKTLTSEGREVSTQGMARIEGGQTQIGNEAYPESRPTFKIDIKPFYMDRTPVTVAHYRAYLEDTGAAQPKYWDDARFNEDEQPVIGVSWSEAQAYATWCGKKLPTEAQWERAARGLSGRTYPWGDDTPTSTRCNSGDCNGRTTQVRQYEDAQTPEGVMDLVGNCFEWTSDTMHHYPPNEDQHADSKERRKVVRGGSWHSGPEALHASYRTGIYPESQLNTVGFRCVLPISRPRKK